MGKTWTPRKVLPKRLRKAVEPLDPTRPVPEGGTCYALCVSPHKAHHVARWVEERYRCQTIIPLETRFRMSKLSNKRGGKRQKREAFQVPLLPRFCFVVFYEPPKWLELEQCQHVNGVVAVNGVPAPLRHHEIEGLRGISEKLKASADPKELQSGMKAVITKPGIMRGKTVEIKQLSGKSAIICKWLETDLEREAKISIEDLDAA